MLHTAFQLIKRKVKILYSVFSVIFDLRSSLLFLRRNLKKKQK